MSLQNVLKSLSIGVCILTLCLACVARQGVKTGDELETEVIMELDIAPQADDLYCVYKVLTVEKGSCPEIKPGFTFCVVCPKNRKCPGKVGKVAGRFELVDRNGNFRCRGTWVKKFKIGEPERCLECPFGVDGRYAFLGPINP